MLAREYNVIKLIVQHGTSVSTAQLTKEQEQQKEYSRYNTNSKNNSGYSSGRGRGGYGGGRGGRGSASGRDRYGRSNGGYGQQTDPTTGNRVKSTSLSFNVDELIAKTTQHTEKEIRRTLDRLRYQGEITTSWEGTALRAKMKSIPTNNNYTINNNNTINTINNSNTTSTQSSASSSSSTSSSTDLSSGGGGGGGVKYDEQLINNVASDLYEIAQLLAKSTISKVEDIYKLASRAAIEYIPSKEPSSKLSMENENNLFSKNVHLINNGLERYFQDKNNVEEIDDREIAAVSLIY